MNVKRNRRDSFPFACDANFQRNKYRIRKVQKNFKIKSIIIVNRRVTKQKYTRNTSKLEGNN